jgi:hypothetical protein
VPLAEGSEKSAVENKQNILLALKICQVDFASFEICQREVWCGFVEFGAAHTGSTKMMPKMISTTKLIQLDCTEDLSIKIETNRTTPMAKYMMPSI